MKSGNVLTDYVGHSDLYYSIYALFEKRLGMNLYRPAGDEGWSEKGIHTTSIPDEEGKPELRDGVYRIPMEMNYAQRAITFKKFLEMDFDIMLVTTWEHEEAFYNLVKRYNPNAIFIRHIANIHEKPLGFCKNVLLATLEPMPPDIDYIRYCPEHNEDYCYTPLSDDYKTIKSFSHHLPSYPNDIDAWNKYEIALQDFTFKMYGQDGRDGRLPHKIMPKAIKESAFVWHLKAGGGGYIPRQALACGRPCIVRKEYCRWHNTLCRELFKDGINCIDIDPKIRTFEENIKLIEEWSEPDTYIERSKIVAEMFKEDVNFEEKAKKIKDWIGNLPKGV